MVLFSCTYVSIFPFLHRFGMLGSIDSNTGSPDCGWDTDQFPMDIKNCTMVMKASSKLFLISLNCIVNI